VDGLPKAWPATTRVVFAVGLKQRRVTALAEIEALGFSVYINARKSSFGALLAANIIFFCG
jgi:hypothetical protein